MDKTLGQGARLRLVEVFEAPERVVGIVEFKGAVYVATTIGLYRMVEGDMLERVAFAQTGPAVGGADAGQAEPPRPVAPDEPYANYTTRVAQLLGISDGDPYPGPATRNGIIRGAARVCGFMVMEDPSMPFGEFRVIAGTWKLEGSGVAPILTGRRPKEWP